MTRVAAPRLLLASASPRRRELLGRLVPAFTVVPADVDESTRAGESAQAYVRRLAEEKAVAIHRGEAAAFVLAADTSVVLGERILGKPVDDADACAMLELLSGTTHVVMTGVAVVTPTGATHAAVETTRVTFRPVPRSELEAYVASGEGRDKAGSYASQAGGAAFISRLEGCPTNVIGLPLVKTRELLLSAGYFQGGARP